MDEVLHLMILPSPLVPYTRGMASALQEMGGRKQWPLEVKVQFEILCVFSLKSVFLNLALVEAAVLIVLVLVLDDCAE
jgi:hypothetical protein